MSFTSFCHTDGNPFSPPELSNSYSKSSKSSSLHSSVIDEFANSPDAAQFEDISLEDTNEVLPEEIYYESKEKASPSIIEHRSPHHVFRSLAGTRRTNYTIEKSETLSIAKPGQVSPNGGNYLNNADQKAQTTLEPQSKGNVGSSLDGSSNPVESKASPATREVRLQTSGLSVKNPTLRRIRSNSPLERRSSSNPRHGSPQIARKTAKELEAEYDDLDEEVPEDAIIWNVPLSPRLGQETTKLGAHTSQEGNTMLRPALVHTYSALSGRSEPFTSRSIISSVADSRISQENTNCPAVKQRSQSWTIALSSLSVEARDLTQQLEEHAEEKEREDQQRQTKGNSSALPLPNGSANKLLRASSVQLPPVRRGDLMIDPLPVSKEKERFMTRTRPSWLPPKNRKEERKHLKEYQKMVAYSIELERKNGAKIAREKQQRNNRLKDLCHSWDNDVLQRWDSAILEPATRDLWWRGVIPHSRGAVWTRAIGNDLVLSNRTYETALARAKTLKAEAQKSEASKTHRPKELEWFDAIERNVGVTWPNLGLFQPGAPLYESSADVLMAYAMYRNDVGFLRGINLPATLLTLSLSPSESFIALSNLLNRPLPLAVIIPVSSSLDHFHEHIFKILSIHLPTLHAHLTSLNIPPSSYLDPLLTTLATWRMPIDIAARIWDVYVFEGDRALVWATVTLFSKLEAKLYGSEEELLNILGWSARDTWDVGSEDDFMTEMRAIADRNIF